MSYIYFIATFIILFSQNGGKLDAICSNVVAVFDFILAFCGLSFIENRFKEKLKYGFVRGLIYAAAISIVNSYAIQLLSIVGMLDSFVDYRGIKKDW